MIFYINIYTNHENIQTTQYTTGFKENDEFVWEIKYIDHSKINASYFWESFTEFDAGASMKIQFERVIKTTNDTLWRIDNRVWGWTSEPFESETHIGTISFPSVDPEPWEGNDFWNLYVFMPYDSYLSALFSSNPNINFHNNMLWFNVSNYKIERIYDDSTGILYSYRIFLHNEIVFSSELI